MHFSAVSGGGVLIARTELHHSLWEFFKRKIRNNPWPVGSVQLDVGPVVVVHLGERDMPLGSKVQVFSHLDVSLSAVLVAVSSDEKIDRAGRVSAMHRLGLDKAAELKGGF